MGVSKNNGTPKLSHFNRAFHEIFTIHLRPLTPWKGLPDLPDINSILKNKFACLYLISMHHIYVGMCVLRYVGTYSKSSTFVVWNSHGGRAIISGNPDLQLDFTMTQFESGRVFDSQPLMKAGKRHCWKIHPATASVGMMSKQWWIHSKHWFHITTSAWRMNCPSTILIPLLLKGRSCSARRFTLTNLLRNLLGSKWKHITGTPPNARTQRQCPQQFKVYLETWYVIYVQGWAVSLPLTSRYHDPEMQPPSYTSIKIKARIVNNTLLP